MLELDPTVQVSVLEAGPRPGGVLNTVRQDGYLIEHSADNFITNVPWALDLCRRLGLESELLTTNAAHRQAKVVFHGRLEEIPAGFFLMAPTRVGPVLKTPVLSLGGKLRLLAEPLVPRGGQDDESLASFVRRRLGREVFERLVQPLVGGIYTADPEKLSLAATLPRFLELERQYGSLVLAALRGAAVSDSANGDSRRGAAGSSSAARYSMFMAPRGGMITLVHALVDRLPAGSLRLNAPVERIRRGEDGRWQLALAGAAGTSSGSQAANGSAETIEADAVIVAVPAYRAAAMLDGVDSQLAGLLSQIPYAGTAIVCAGYDRQSFGVPLDSFGFVVPACERRRILAASFSSIKFPGRAPEGEVLVRVFLGGACQPEIAELNDAAIREIAAAELAELLKISAPPRFQQVVRWPRSMPQYHVGHLKLVAQIQELAGRHPRLALAGNAYQGVGVPQCVRSGEAAAEAVMRTTPAPAAR